MSIATTQSANPIPVGVIGSWDLKFQDEFNGTSLDKTKWNDNWLGNAGAITKPVNSAEIGAYDPAQVSVSGGNLQLTAVQQSTRAADGKTYAYKSGLIESADKHEFTEGYFEARIYMPDDGGNELYNWGAFWLNGHHNSWPDAGENDIMENLSGGPAWHYHSPGGSTGKTPAMDPKGWHTYAAQWEAGSVKYYYDGKLVGERTSGVLNKPNYMVLNYGLSNEHGGPIAGNKTMLVDYVRVWQKGDGTPVSTPTPTPGPTDNAVVAASDRYATTEDKALAVNATQGVLINDTAADGGKTAVAGTFATTEGGIVTLNADGSFVYTPESNFYGSDSFRYTARDVDGDTSTASVTFAVADVAETSTPTTSTTLSGTSSANSLTGTSGSDRIDGRSGNDKIWGKGGTDTLVGGADSDTFVFDTALGSSNVDTITDFYPRYDTIQLENAIFSKLNYTGQISSSHFQNGRPDDSNDYIWYDRSTGQLNYDSDGNGSAASVHFATLANRNVLTVADLIII